MDKMKDFLMILVIIVVLFLLYKLYKHIMDGGGLHAPSIFGNKGGLLGAGGLSNLPGGASYDPNAAEAKGGLSVTANGNIVQTTTGNTPGKGITDTLKGLFSSGKGSSAADQLKGNGGAVANTFVFDKGNLINGVYAYDDEQLARLGIYRISSGDYYEYTNAGKQTYRGTRSQVLDFYQKSNGIMPIWF